MPAPDEQGRFILVQKDPDTGEMIPVIRRGHKAHLEKNRERVWEPVG